MKGGYFGKIDRYIIKQFLFGFFFTVALIVSIAITIDLGEKIDKFFKNHLSMRQVVGEYYLNFIPYIVALLGPYFVFITVIFFTSQLAGKSEIIAMFNSGMSFRRFLFPYMVSALFLAAMFWTVNNYIVPNTNKQRLAFENKYIAFNSTFSQDHIHRRLKDSTFLYFRIFDKTTNTATYTTLEKFQHNLMTYKLLAEKATYDSATKKWTAHNYFIRTIDSQNHQTLTRGEKMNLNIELDPTIFTKRWTVIEELNRRELKDKIDELKQQGATDTAQYECEYHRRTASAFGIILLTIIGATIASKKVRGGMGIHLLMGILLCSIYEIIQKFTVSFALKAHWNPLLSVWIPNLIFIGVATLLWKKYQEEG